MVTLPACHIVGWVCCLPLFSRRRLSPPSGGKIILWDHDGLYYFEAQSHGLHHHYTRLRTPRCRDARGFATVLPGYGFGPVGLAFAYRLTDWVTSTSFIHLL